MLSNCHSQDSKGVFWLLKMGRESASLRAPSPSRDRGGPQPSTSPFSPQGPLGACWRAWRAGVAWRPGARGPGTCSAQAPGSYASPTARAASRRPLGPRARASAARAAPPRGVARNCAPARRLRTNARHRVSPAFNPTPSRHGPSGSFHNLVTLFRELGTREPLASFTYGLQPVPMIQLPLSGKLRTLDFSPALPGHSSPLPSSQHTCLPK